MADTTGMIPLWIIGTVTDIHVIGLWFIFQIGFIAVVIGWIELWT